MGFLALGAGFVRHQVALIILRALMGIGKYPLLFISDQRLTFDDRRGFDNPLRPAYDRPPFPRPGRASQRNGCIRWIWGNR